MPEKPEVMTVVKKLDPMIIGRKITGCNIYYNNIISEPSLEEFKKNIEWAQKAIEELRGALNFEYELSNNLNEIYLFCNRCLSECIYKNSTDSIVEAKSLMNRLYESFKVAAQSDDSEKMMDNVQSVYAGITYSKDNLNETYSNDTNRGFLA